MMRNKSKFDYLKRKYGESAAYNYLNILYSPGEEYVKMRKALGDKTPEGILYALHSTDCHHSNMNLLAARSRRKTELTSKYKDAPCIYDPLESTPVNKILAQLNRTKYYAINDYVWVTYNDVFECYFVSNFEEIHFDPETYVICQHKQLMAEGRFEELIELYTDAKSKIDAKDNDKPRKRIRRK